MKTKRLATYGLLIALAMIFSYLESMLPPIGIPGVKLGLANLVGMVALYLLGPLEAVMITVVRVFFTAITFGNMSAMMFSLSGAALSLLSMVLFKKLGFFGKVGVSVIGGVMHNVGQLLMACFILESRAVFSYLPVLMLSGTIAGIAIGILTGLVIVRLPDSIAR